MKFTKDKNKMLVFLEFLVELPSFEDWFSIVVTNIVTTREKVQEDVIL
jgi:hypothetical protein